MLFCSIYIVIWLVTSKYLQNANLRPWQERGDKCKVIIEIQSDTQIHSNTIKYKYIKIQSDTQIHSNAEIHTNTLKYKYNRNLN